MTDSAALTPVTGALIIPRVSPKRPQFVSVRELARDLHLSPGTLHYYLERIKVRTLSAGSAGNSTRFIRAADVVDVVAAIEAYRKKRPVPGMTASEAAKELGVAESTIRVLVAQGRLKARHVGRRLSFTRDEIARYGRGRRVSA